MKRLIREPLVHFLLLGAGLFLAYDFVGMRTDGEPGTIVVTQGRIENLAATFARTWQRPPTEEELGGLIQDYVREEVAARQALAMGLDRDDTIIRRRLRQKLEFISEDLASQAEPTDDELRAYLNAHPDAFGVERRLSFSQVYLNLEAHRESLADDAARLLAELNRDGAAVDAWALGDATLLEHTFENVPAREVVKQFGDKFAAKLDELPVGRWQGPVESGYGAHLVLVRERTEGRLPSLDDVRDAVRREWANARRLEANEKFYQSLVKRYTVTIDRPQPTEKTGNHLARAK
jgi:hypothetical protein